MFKIIKKWNHRRLQKRHEKDRLTQISQQLHWLQQAFVDNGMSKLKLQIEVLGCPKKYEYLLFSIRPSDVVIDGGANLGLFSDLMLNLGAKVYTFEPNPALTYHLKKKYEGNINIKLIEAAISTKEDNLVFTMPCSGSFIEQSQGGTLDCDLEMTSSISYPVKSINFCKFIDSVLEENKIEKIKFIKMDIEGAEFDVLNQILDNDYFDKFEHLVCETHERFFKDGTEKLASIKAKMALKNVTNIYLDWI